MPDGATKPPVFPQSYAVCPVLALFCLPAAEASNTITLSKKQPLKGFPLRLDSISLLPTLQDWPFDDGAPPPSKIVEDWLNLLKTKFCEDPGCCVAVHCVAGLGRAPVLVALALIESGMKYEDAIQFIRQKRRGAINSKQLTYLEKYRPKQRLRFKDPHNHKNKCCIM
ncbi:PREDICTED: protein tyrosine phosphatase type IVA 3 isoform X1 [Ficedula albicollis]|nr:PREDICTED: protein tyrosine phosphatase type IVA 3 isoform X1 [Ficedula albicollis]